MDNKYFLPIIVAGLTIVFVVVSIMVFVSGKNAYFIKKKLRVGALLITLTGAAAGCGENIVTCYDPIPSNLFHIDRSNQTNEITINPAVADTLSGRIENRNGEKFSFAVLGQKDTVIQKDNIKAIDGAFDESLEEFRITIGKNIPSGSYNLRLYSCEKDSISSSRYYNNSFALKIINSK
jgi:hypothetical protein